MVLFGKSERVEDGKLSLKGFELRAKVHPVYTYFEHHSFYLNDSEKPLEVVYTFGLPEEAAIIEVTAQLGSRKVYMEVLESEEAEERYRQAIDRGDSAFMTQEVRPNVKELTLGRLLPGENLKVSLKAIMPTQWENLTTLRFYLPTGLGVRYIPGQLLDDGKGTDVVPDASRVVPPVSDSVNYKFSAYVKLELDDVVEVTSPSHEIVYDKESRIVTLRHFEDIPDRDLIINIKVGRQQETSLVYASYHDAESGYLGVTFIPPDSEAFESRPMRLMILLDKSGSMMGPKFDALKISLSELINRLKPEDEFQIIVFNHSHYSLFPGFLPATLDNKRRALRELENLKADGGTELYQAFVDAIHVFKCDNVDSKENKLLLITDAEVGDEKRIIEHYLSEGKGISIYALGIDTTVNSYLLNELAKASGGYVVFCYPTESVAEKVNMIWNALRTGERFDLKLEGTSFYEIYPQLRYLYKGLPLRAFLRYKRPLDSVKLKIEGERFSFESELELARVEGEGVEGIEKLWAMAKLRYLEMMNRDDEALKLALKYQLLSRYTTFIAVLEREEKDTGELVKQRIPIYRPRDWQMFDDVLYDVDDVLYDVDDDVLYEIDCSSFRRHRYAYSLGGIGVSKLRSFITYDFYVPSYVREIGVNDEKLTEEFSLESLERVLDVLPNESLRDYILKLFRILEEFKTELKRKLAEFEEFNEQFKSVGGPEYLKRSFIRECAIKLDSSMERLMKRQGLSFINLEFMLRELEDYDEEIVRFVVNYLQKLIEDIYRILSRLPSELVSHSEHATAMRTLYNKFAFARLRARLQKRVERE